MRYDDTFLCPGGCGGEGRAESGADRRSRIARLRVAVDGGEAWTRALERALLDAGIGATVRAAADLSHADIAAGVFAAADTAAIAAFADAARRAGIPSTTALVDRGCVLVGPPALPGRAGCWHCAWLRSRATARWRTAEAPLADDPALAVHALMGKICASAATARDPRPPLLTAIDAAGAPAFHRFLPVPGCRLCGGAAGPGPDHPPAEEEQAASRMLDDFVDPLCGIVAHLLVEPPAATAGAPLVITAVPADAPDDPPRARPMPLGWGKGLALAPAVVSALGEAVERYAGSIVDPARITVAPLADLPGDVLDPRDCALYAEDQYARPGFPFARFDPALAHPWVRGRWADDDAPVWAPAVLTHLALDLAPGQAFVQGSSNGLAAGPDAGEAATRAMLELVERDAFMSAWLTGRPARRLDRALAGEELAPVLETIESLGAQVQLALFDSACGYPVVACFGFGDGVAWPGATVGLGADPNPRTALRQAVLELGQTGSFLRDLMLGDGPIAEADRVAEMQDHARYYFAPANAAALEALVGAESAALPAPRPRSRRLCGIALAEAGARTALVDMTPSDVATTPVRVVRAVSAGLQPIAFGHGLARRSIARIFRQGVIRGPNAIAPIW